MVTATTKGVKISVDLTYSKEHSYPHYPRHTFIYQITITNNNPFSVRLLRRHWYIFDSVALKPREIEGEGVVGQTPIIEPGEGYQYTSWSPLRSEIGRMYGTYLMEQLSTGQQFTVRIPAFSMEVPYKKN